VLPYPVVIFSKRNVPAPPTNIREKPFPWGGAGLSGEVDDGIAVVLLGGEVVAVEAGGIAAGGAGISFDFYGLGGGGKTEGRNTNDC